MKGKTKTAATIHQLDTQGVGMVPRDPSNQMPLLIGVKSASKVVTPISSATPAIAVRRSATQLLNASAVPARKKPLNRPTRAVSTGVPRKKKTLGMIKRPATRNQR